MKRLALAIAASAALALLGAAPALGAYGLKDLSVTFNNKDGSSTALAGTHPFAMTSTLAINSTKIDPGVQNCEVNDKHPGEKCEVPDGETQNLTVDLPPGFVGNATAVPQCSGAEFSDIDKALSQPACGSDTAVGIVGVKAEFEPAREERLGTYAYVPVYNLVPPPGVAAELGFLVLNVPVQMDILVSESFPYNLQARLHNVSQAVLFYGAKLTIWGNPSDPEHDSIRGRCLDAVHSEGKPISLGECQTPPAPPFITLPRSCQGPLTTTFAAQAWNTGESDIESTLTEGMNECAGLNFSPTMGVRPSTTSTESPAGIEVDFDVKDEGLSSATGTAKSDIRKVVLALPRGMTINPSAAEGLAVCSKAQYDAASLVNPGCPEASKLGTVHVTTPLLGEAVEGSLYIAQQDDPATAQPGAENPFDSLLATYLILRNQRLGIFVKQAGKIEPDHSSGQIITTFDEIPQFPLSHIGVRFREGPRGPLVTPPTCAPYTATAALTPWSGNPAIPATSTFNLTSGPGGSACPPGGVPPFHPGFEAGSINNNASSYSPFYLRLTRADGEQDMTRFDSILPPGVTGKIAGVPRCPDAAIAAAKTRSGRAELASPSCPADSQIGHILAGAGVGPALTYVSGKIYLAGPFGGDPLSIVVITPAVAGPFDVGTVVTREALTLDPETAEVQVDGAASDPIPHILEGVPLKLRDLRVYVDRQNFTLNPTSCDPEQVRATLFGSFLDVFSPADDVPVSLTQRYQAANCANLGFKPKLSLKLKGGTRRDDHPALHSTVTYPYRSGPGYANIAKAVVTLPPSEFIDNRHINNPCTRVQFNANSCPKSSVLGTARATTPLLDQPLEGPVYFRSNGGARLLPDIVADLKGQFNIVLVGYVDSKNARIRTTFANVPDAPVGKFTLDLNGGKKGLLVNNRNLCAHQLRSKVALIGQNGKAYDTQPVLATSCAAKAKH